MFKVTKFWFNMHTQNKQTDLFLASLGSFSSDFNQKSLVKKVGNPNSIK